MHLFLRSVGFLAMRDDNEAEKFIKQVVKQAIASDSIHYDDRHPCSVIKVMTGEGFGLMIKGSLQGKNRFKMEYYYPYLESNCVMSCDEITIERHADKDSYAVVCEEIKIGVTLILYLSNVYDYYRHKLSGRSVIMDRSVAISAFSREGQILLPLLKNDRQIKKCEKDTLVRNKLIAAARQGDEEAMESLTIDEMDTYNKISDRIRREDVYSIVDTSLMPCGVECDQYAVIGTILECDLRRNTITSEEVWIMVLECNDFMMRMAINKEDLFGEPQVGRRFKGKLWICGKVNFE